MNAQRLAFVVAALAAVPASALAQDPGTPPPPAPGGPTQPAPGDPSKPAPGGPTQPAPSGTQQPAPGGATQPAPSGSTQPAGASQPDLETAAEPLAAPGSADNVNYQVDSARPRHAGILKNGPVSLIDPVIDEANENLKKKYGLEFGAAYTAVWQDATDGDVDDAAGGDADIYARWRIMGREDEGTRSVLGMNFEYRHAMGSYSPADIGPSVGSLWGTTDGFGRQKASIVQYWWEQHLLRDSLVLTFGKLDPANYYNTNRYQDDNTAFLSQMFSSNPARAHPQNGLGANAKFKFGDGLYVLGGFQDAAAEKTHTGFGTIDEHEFFVAGEVGWTPKFKNLGKGAYRVTLWHIDERDDDDIPSDWGIGISCEQEFGCVVPFGRLGWSDGDATGVKTFIGGGVGLEGMLRAKEDLTGIGIGWGDPDDGSLDQQWGAEVFHRFQLAPDVQLTFGYQYILDPANEAVDGGDQVGIFEIRLRIAF